MVSTRGLLLGLAVVGVSMIAAPKAQAAVYSVNDVVNLGTLISSGGTIQIGGLVFSGFSASATNNMPTPSNVNLVVEEITLSGGAISYGFQVQGAFIDMGTAQGSDFGLNYNVAASDPTAAVTTAYLHSNNFNVGTGFGDVVETYTPGNNIAGIYVSSFGSQLSQTVALTPMSNSYHVEKDILLYGNAAGVATVSQIDQTFVVSGSGALPPVPEPASLGLLGLGAIGLLTRRRSA